MKYSYFKNENGNYVIRHTDSVTKVETVIAFTDDAEKADFLCKAANAFKYNGEQKPKCSGKRGRMSVWFVAY